MRRKSTQIVQVPVRMKEFLRAELEKAAKANGASLNGEIARRLEQSLQHDITEQRHKEIIARLEALETREDRAAAGYPRTGQTTWLYGPWVSYSGGT